MIRRLTITYVPQGSMIDAVDRPKVAYIALHLGITEAADLIGHLSQMMAANLSRPGAADLFQEVELRTTFQAFVDEP